MMQPVRAAMLVAVALACAPLPAAQAASCFEGQLRSRSEPDGIHLQVTLAKSEAGTCWTPPAAIDVYRRPLGGECGDAVRITPQPIPWVETPAERRDPYIDFEIVDASAEPNAAYRYEVRAVDAERNPVATNADTPIGHGTHGIALLGHGVLVAGAECGSNWLVSLRVCGGRCFATGWVVEAPPSVQSYFNTGTTVSVWGEWFGAEVRLCDRFAQLIRVVAVEESECVLGVSDVTWGDAKRLYR